MAECWSEGLSSALHPRTSTSFPPPTVPLGLRGTQLDSNPWHSLPFPSIREPPTHFQSPQPTKGIYFSPRSPLPMRG